MAVTWQGVLMTVAISLAVLIDLACAVAMLLTRTALDQLHFVTPAATVSVVLILVAVLLQEGLAPPGIQMLVITAAMLVTGPILAHATARVAYIRQTGAFLEAPKERE